jgi:hypothetical protein
MKEWIRNWLGITDIVNNQQMLFNEHAQLHNKVDKANKTLNAIGPGLGRVIAKLDANYAKDELDPDKRAESDRIGEEALRRLAGEAAARAPYNET